MKRLNKTLSVTFLVILSTLSIDSAHSENAHQILVLNQEMQEVSQDSSKWDNQKNNEFNGPIKWVKHKSYSNKENQNKNQELAEWYEQAHSYYTDVQMGVAPKPNDKEWKEFINQMNWAYQQLHGFDELQSDPFGGISGPNGDIIYDFEENQITATGASNIHRSWGNNSDLIVPSMAAGISYEPTQDSQIEPPQKVIKIVVKDNASNNPSGFTGIDPRQIKMQTPHNPQTAKPKGAAITSATIMGFNSSKSESKEHSISKSVLLRKIRIPKLN